MHLSRRCRSGSRWLGLTAVLLLLSGCAEWLRWQHEVTVTIRTPDGSVDMSAVHTVSLETTTDAYDRVISGVAGPDAYRYHITGQAPHMVLPSGEIIVALMMGHGTLRSEPGNAALQYLSDPETKGPENDDAARNILTARPNGYSVDLPHEA